MAILPPVAIVERVLATLITAHPHLSLLEIPPPAHSTPTGIQAKQPLVSSLLYHDVKHLSTSSKHMIQWRLPKFNGVPGDHQNGMDPPLCTQHNKFSKRKKCNNSSLLHRTDLCPLTPFWEIILWNLVACTHLSLGCWAHFTLRVITC